MFYKIYNFRKALTDFMAVYQPILLISIINTLLIQQIDDYKNDDFYTT